MRIKKSVLVTFFSVLTLILLILLIKANIRLQALSDKNAPESAQLTALPKKSVPPYKYKVNFWYPIKDPNNEAVPFYGRQRVALQVLDIKTGQSISDNSLSVSASYDGKNSVRLFPVEATAKIVAHWKTDYFIVPMGAPNINVLTITIKRIINGQEAIVGSDFILINTRKR